MSAGRVEPRVTWPRSVVADDPFLVSVDLALVGDAAQSWPFEAEEIEFTCVLDGARHFRVEAVDDACVVVHRFGGSYGPARFLVTARPAPGRHALRLTSLTSNGIVMGSVEVPVEVCEALDGGGVEEPVTVAAPAPVPWRTALCVVMSQYESLPMLPGAHEAGSRVVRALTVLGYECTVLTDPTVQRLREEASRFLTAEGSGPRIVYFSGHGLVHLDGGLLLAARDSRDERMVTTLALFRELADLTQSRADAPPTLFLLDTCYSGRAAQPERYGTTPPAYVVASCAATDLALAHLFSDSLAGVLDRSDGRSLPDRRRGRAAEHAGGGSRPAHA